MNFKRIPLIARIPIASAIGLILTFAEAWLFDEVPAAVVSHIPALIITSLNLPGVIYCNHLIATEALPADDVPIFQMGQAAQCYFVGLILNVPYYACLILFVWWLFEKWTGTGKVASVKS
jgi:hypothetical protein